MKKTALRIVSLLIALLMVLALAACNEDSGSTDKKNDDNKETVKTKTIYGTWISDEMDFAKIEGSGSGEGGEGGEGAGLSLEDLGLADLKVKMIYTFKEDGTYTQTFDDASLNVLTEKMADFSVKMMESMAQAMGTTLEELLATMGQTLEEYKAEVSNKDDYKETGKFKTDGGKLFTLEDVEEDETEEGGEGAPAEERTFNENVYFEYELSGDTLTFKNYVDPEDPAPEGLFPIVFHRS